MACTRIGAGLINGSPFNSISLVLLNLRGAAQMRRDRTSDYVSALGTGKRRRYV
jgi:hypothetical protein